VVSVLILNVLVVNVGLSAPVIIDGDSQGSWTDSFEDELGMESSTNLSVQDGNVWLGPAAPFNGTNWTRRGLAIDSGGTYDTNRADNPCVMREANTYKMWYRGIDGGSINRILYATSPDGLDWTKQGVVLNEGSPGELDDEVVSAPKVIRDGDLYKMWYNGDDGATDRIFFAFSEDGTNWTKYGMVMEGTPGQQDQNGVFPCTVMKDTDGTYKMWYQGIDANFRIFYAESSDGINWNKQGLVLDLGPGAFDDTHVSGAAVVKEHEFLYRMWYSGHGGITDYKIFYAISTDGTNWIKQTPIALDWGAPGAIDDWSVSYCCVMKDDIELYKMWYGGNEGSGNIRIMYATTPIRYQNGQLTSTKITLPEGLTWNRLTINKTVPGIHNSLNVTILDGETYLPITGFENLTGAVIDISSIDYLLHPTIRLKATFVGKNESSPILHDWSVSWVDTIPPAIPSGLTINNPFTGYSLILSWDSNSELDLDSYVIYISTDNVTFNWLTNISAGPIAFIHNGLTQGITYFYKIAAADEVPNQSPFTYVVEGVPDTDYDGDNIGDIDDPDDDNDGIPDFSDPYPLNPLNDIESTIDYMNITIEDIQTRVIIIQTILENLNLTELLNAINYLNQTLPTKIDDLSNQLTGVNDSLMGMVTDSETNILTELANVDTSLSNEIPLSNEIQNALVSITNDIIDMNTSISDELTTLLNTMTTEHDSLQQWLELVLDLIDTNLTKTNNTLHSQLDYLDQSITNFYNNLEDDIGDVLSDLLMHDQITGQNHTDIIGLLLDLLDGQIEKEQIEDLKTRLINLANDLSGHNQTIADDIMDVVSDIDAFEDNVNQQLNRINNTLDQLAKLEEILGDLEELDQSLEQTEENIQDSVDERSTRDEDEKRFFMIELFLIILFILLIINLTATILMRKRKKEEDGPSRAPEREQPPPPPPQIPTNEGQNKEVES
jgi:predicted GH43/DUF377 family glycosyl hydrolase